MERENSISISLPRLLGYWGTKECYCPPRSFLLLSARRQQLLLHCGTQHPCAHVHNPWSVWWVRDQVNLWLLQSRFRSALFCRLVTSSHICLCSDAGRGEHRRSWRLYFNLTNMENNDGHWTCSTSVSCNKRQMAQLTQERNKLQRPVNSKINTCHSSPWSFRTVRRFSTIVPNA